MCLLGADGFLGHRVRPCVSCGREYPRTPEKMRRIAFRVHAGGSARGHLKKIRRAAFRAHAGGRRDAAKLAGDPKKVSHAGGRRTPLPRGVCRAGAVRLLMHTPPVSLSAASGQDRRNRFFSEREYAVYCVKNAPRLLSSLRSILRIPRKPQELRLRLRESEARGRRPCGEGRHTQ